MRVQLRAALSDAMKARDCTAVAALRSALAAIDNAEAVEPPEVDTGGPATEMARRLLTDGQILRIVRSEVSQRLAAAQDYQQAGQLERAERLRTEAQVIDRASAGYGVHPLIAGRWSPRGLDPAAEVSDDELLVLFEAARWAASAGNLQPARYLVGRRGSRTHERIFGVLKPSNQRWAGAAAALVLGIAVTADESGRAIPYARYDLGQASAQLALQAVAGGLVAHQMAGFLPDAARAEFALPQHHEPTVVVAIGRLGGTEGLPQDLRERELRPRTRRPLADTVFTGDYGSPAFP